MAVCPNCGKDSVEYRREDAGFRKTRAGSERVHRTVAFCKSCGKTWISDDVKTPSKKKKSSLTTILLTIIGLFFGLIILSMYIGGISDNKHKSEKQVDYAVTSTNVANVTNPSQEYVNNALKTIPGIFDIEFATADHDPNELLGEREDSATCVVFFAYDQVDQSQFKEASSIDKGTECGGCVEVFRNEKAAANREKKLSIFRSGSHVQIGTVIVRTSEKISYEEQDKLEGAICHALLGE